MAFLYCLVSLLAVFDVVRADLNVTQNLIAFQFNPKAEWLESANWNNVTGSPCDGDTVHFHHDAETVVFYEERNTPLGGIELFADGSLVLGEESVLQFGDAETLHKAMMARPNPGKHCKGRAMPIKANYSYSRRTAWFDPSNWETPDALLHVEQVPGPYDIVHLFATTSYKIYIDHSVEVAQLCLNTPVMGIPALCGVSQTDIDNVVQSTEGSWQFEDGRVPLDSEFGVDVGMGNDDMVNALITVRYETKCEDPDHYSTCLNANLDDEYFDLICNFAKNSCNTAALNCTEPITPAGHCCPMCGSLIELSGDRQLDSRYVKHELFARTMNCRGGPKNLRFSMLRLDAKRFQIVMAPRNPDDREMDYDAQLIESCTRALVYALKQYHSVYPETIKVTTSKGKYAGAEKSGLIVALVMFFLLLLTVVVIVAAYLMYRRGRLRNIVAAFYRSDQDEEHVQLELGEEPDFESHGNRSSRTTAGFANPSYSALQKAADEQEDEALLYHDFEGRVKEVTGDTTSVNSSLSGYYSDASLTPTPKKSERDNTRAKTASMSYENPMFNDDMEE